MTQTQEKYSTKNLTTQFTLDSLQGSVTYLTQEKKKYSFIPIGYIANIQMVIDKTEINREFEISLSKKKGNEIKNVEDILYSMVDESIRNVAQKKLVVENRTNSQADNSFFDPNIKTMQAYLSSRPLQTEDDSLFTEYRNLIQLTDQLIRSIVHVTQLQEITKEGFIAYQEKVVNRFSDTTKDDIQNDITDKIKNTTSKFNEETKIQTKDISIQKIVKYMEHKINPQSDTREIQKQVLAYLEHVSKGDQKILTGEQAKIIVEDFVPQYVVLRDKTYLATFPKNLLDHGLNSIWEGGVIGGIGLTIAEWITNLIFHTHFNFPCFGIGAGTVFVWPGVKMVATPYYRYKEKKEFQQLLSETTSELKTIPSNEKSLFTYIQEKRTEHDSPVKKVFLEIESPKRDSIDSVIARISYTDNDTEVNSEDRTERKKEFEKSLAHILQLYNERKGDYDTVSDIREAVSETKQMYLETKIPLDHLPFFITGLDFGERDVNVLCTGVTSLMKNLYSTEKYDLDQIVSLINQVRKSADEDDNNAETIADEVIALLQ